MKQGDVHKDSKEPGELSPVGSDRLPLEFWRTEATDGWCSLCKAKAPIGVKVTMAGRHVCWRFCASCVRDMSECIDPQTEEPGNGG